MVKLKDEIRQKRPFESLEEEVALALMRTADQVSAPVQEALREAGLSVSQYNILRILRGAGEEGHSCGAIAERMVRRDPDLTRLLDRLEARGLVSRSRDTRDRRVVLASITAEGSDLLAEVDRPVSENVRGVLAHMKKQRLRELLELLEEVRSGGQA